jgi:hypothetical protein
MHRCKKYNILSPKNIALYERNIKYDERTYGMIRSESLTKLSATGKSFSASIATAAVAGSSTAASETSAGGASRVAAERETEGALMDAGAKAEVDPAAAAMMKAENFMVESLLKLK